MKFGFRQKQQLIGIFLFIVVVAQSGFVLLSVNQIGEASSELIDKEMTILNSAHELKLAVVQVQQWLTDISATRGWDGLNDGFDEAKNNADIFYALIEKLTVVDAENAERYRQMLPVFKEYFAVGKQMAQFYIDEGPEGGNRMMATFDEAAASMSEQVDSFLEMVIHRSQTKGSDSLQSISNLQNISLIATIVLLGALILAIWQGYSLLKFLGHDPEILQTVANNIAKGDLSAHADEDNANGVFASLASMRKKLKEQLDSIRIQVEENGRIKTALDNVSSNVMVADNERNIIFCNKAVREMFQNAETDIRNEMPGFDASNLLNTNIDDFHKNPKHQADLLATFTSTYSTEMDIGGRTMKVIANPVIDESGTRLGSVVEWADRTTEVAIEHEIENLVSAAQKGNLDTRLSLEGKSGFTAILARNLNGMLDILSSTFEDVNSVMSTLANGDLSQNITRNYEGIFGEAKENINSTISHLSGIVSEIRGATDEIVSGSKEISSGNNNLSSRTEQQASALEETAASMEELISTVDQNSNNTQAADKLASDAVKVAREGGEVITNAVSAMSAITDSSNQIAEIISVIDEIAFQTNLLALNASVEAARAGEQGRGFAVVASEVRNLAQRSATAAREIKDLIQDSVSKVRSGSELVNRSGESLKSIVEGVQKVGDIISEIAVAGREQSQGISQVVVTVNSLDGMTQQNAALAEETTAASVSMNERAQMMSKSIEFFKM